MLGKLLAASVVFTCPVLIASAADSPSARPSLTAAQIVERNVTARGGLQEWRAVKAITESGKLGAGGDQREKLPAPVAKAVHGPSQPLAQSGRLKEEAQLPFVMELERPRKMRFELQFKGQTAVQVYDGVNGWKLRPFLNRLEVEPYTADELKLASAQTELDGPLVDCVAKGTKVELAGMEKVEDRDTYNLKLTFKGGETSHVWVDAQTFLEAKMEGQPRRLDGKMHPVEIYYRDYRPVNGLQFPFVIETRVLPTAAGQQAAREPRVPAEKITIEKIVINPKLDESKFTKPAIEAAGANRHS